MRHSIASATWRAQVVAGRNDRFFRAYPISSDWNADSVSWNNLPGHPNDHVEGYGPANGEWAALDLTQWMANWTAGVWPSKGIALDSAGRDSDL